jgi:hypothetical protein
VDTVREMMKFIIGKEGRGLQVWSLPRGMEKL